MAQADNFATFLALYGAETTSTARVLKAIVEASAIQRQEKELLFAEISKLEAVESNVADWLDSYVPEASDFTASGPLPLPEPAPVNLEDVKIALAEFFGSDDGITAIERTLTRTATTVAVVEPVKEPVDGEGNQPAKGDKSKGK